MLLLLFITELVCGEDAPVEAMPTAGLSLFLDQRGLMCTSYVLTLSETQVQLKVYQNTTF